MHSIKGIIANRLVDRKVGLRSILDGLNVGRIGEIISGALSTNMRLLHHIVSRIFLPKTR